MLRRLLIMILLAWGLGFGWFALTLPKPVDGIKTDAVIVLTGGSGRIKRGIAVLDKGWAAKMLVSGVDKDVKPHEFAVLHHVSAKQLSCCITLGFEATDTRSNAREAARWIARHEYETVRLVTTDWHMPRAAFELARMAPPSVRVTQDAIGSDPSWRTLFYEYHKLLARWISQAWGG